MAHYPTAATLLESAVHTTAVTDEAATAVTDLAAMKRAEITLTVVAMGGVAGDVLDVYVDVEVSPGVFANAVHFPQIAGNGAAAKHVAVLDPSNPGASTIAVTADAAAGGVRPALWGLSMRVRHTLVDAGAHGQSAEFGVEALLQ